MHVEEVYFVCHIVFCSFLIQIHNTIIEFGASRLCEIYYKFVK